MSCLRTVAEPWQTRAIVTLGLQGHLQALLLPASLRAASGWCTPALSLQFLCPLTMCLCISDEGGKFFRLTRHPKRRLWWKGDCKVHACLCLSVMNLHSCEGTLIFWAPGAQRSFLTAFLLRALSAGLLDLLFKQKLVPIPKLHFNYEAHPQVFLRWTI